MERELAYELIALIDNPIVANYKSSGFRIPLEGEHLIEKLGKGYPPYIKEIPGKPHILRTYLENAINASYTFITTGVKHNEISKWKEMKNTVETNIKTIERKILENPDDTKLNNELDDSNKNLDFLEDKLKHMEPETVTVEVNLHLFNSAKKFINIITKRDDEKLASSIYNMVKRIKENNNYENNNDYKRDDYKRDDYKRDDCRRDNYRSDIYKREQISEPNTYIPPHLKNKINGNNYGDRRLYDNNRNPYDGERRPYNGERKPYDGERRPYNGDRKPYDGDRKPYDGDRRSYIGERKPYDGDRRSYIGERKPYDGERRPYNGDRKPYDGERRSYIGERKPYDRERRPYNKDKIDDKQDNSLKQKQEIENLKIDDNIMFPEIKHIEKQVTINKTVWGKPLSKDILIAPPLEINKNITKHNDKDTNKIEYISSGGYLEQIEKEKEKEEENKKNIQKESIEESWSCN